MVTYYTIMWNFFLFFQEIGLMCYLFARMKCYVISFLVNWQ